MVRKSWQKVTETDRECAVRHRRERSCRCSVVAQAGTSRIHKLAASHESNSEPHVTHEPPCLVSVDALGTGRFFTTLLDRSPFGGGLLVEYATEMAVGAPVRDAVFQRYSSNVCLAADTRVVLWNSESSAPGVSMKLSVPSDTVRLHVFVFFFFLSSNSFQTKK